MKEIIGQRPTFDFLDFDIYPSMTKIETDSIVFNIKSVVILTKDAKEEDLIFLDKIMTAIGKKKEEIAIINQKNIPPFRLLNQKQKINFLLVFGLQPKAIGLQIAPVFYKFFLFQNTKILLANSLPEIAKNDRYKKTLWRQMQQMF